MDGSLGPWSSYGPCSKSCGTGSRTRVRHCDNPKPRYGGMNCSSDLFEEIQSCNVETCPRELKSSYSIRIHLVIIIIIIIIIKSLFTLQNGSADTSVTAGINPCAAKLKYVILYKNLQCYNA